MDAAAVVLFRSYHWWILCSENWSRPRPESYVPSANVQSGLPPLWHNAFFQYDNWGEEGVSVGQTTDLASDRWIRVSTASLLRLLLGAHPLPCHLHEDEVRPFPLPVSTKEPMETLPEEEEIGSGLGGPGGRGGCRGGTKILGRGKSIGHQRGHCFFIKKYFTCAMNTFHLQWCGRSLLCSCASFPSLFLSLSGVFVELIPSPHSQFKRPQRGKVEKFKRNFWKTNFCR